MTKVLAAVAWPYANGPRHLGHVAGFGVPSDVFARFMRMSGHAVLMVSGSDEHGTPILVLADQQGVTARELVDVNHAVIAHELADLGCSYDLYTRTTTVNHYAVAQELFRQVWANGYMIERTTRGAISPSTGRTLPDRYIEGTCPICGYGEARGDQCDNCGNQLEPEELINPRSKINGETPEFVETQHFFLDLPALAGSADALLWQALVFARRGRNDEAWPKLEAARAAFAAPGEHAGELRAIVRLAGAVLAEQTDEWAEGRRYLGLEVLTRCRATTAPTTEPEIGADHLPALTA